MCSPSLLGPVTPAGYARTPGTRAALAAGVEVVGYHPCRCNHTELARNAGEDGDGQYGSNAKS